MEEKVRRHSGFLLDVSRHFMPVEDILKLLDAAALCGMDYMHWHLTDDQGWRLEIKKYPRLTEVASRRGPSCFGAVSETENNNGYYAQEDVAQIVSYAHERGMEIIPEIEIPGHAGAMLAAYPEYGCRREIASRDGLRITEHPYRYQVVQEGGIFPHLICAGKEEALAFLKDILDEVLSLFPAPAVHIGGDEAIKQHWRRCPDCQRKMREEGLKSEEELQRLLVLQIGEYLAKRGRKTIVYNDSLAGGVLPPHFIVQHWMGNEKETADFARAGGSVICSDVEHYYFDYPYAEIDLHDIWQAPRIPHYMKGCEDRLLGLECMLWTERVTNLRRASYLLFPRLPAAALKAASEEKLSWADETKKMRQVCERLQGMGLSAAPERMWHLNQDEKEADRAADQAMRQSPGAAEAERKETLLLRQEELEKLLIQIGMPRLFALRVMDSAWKLLPEYCGTEIQEDGDGVKALADQLLIALEEREKGAWKTIPEQVWVDTMKCFSRFVREHEISYGYAGYDRDWWTVRQIRGKLFRIGELEYELKEKEGKRSIDMHIPSDTKMKRELLEQSVLAAKEFLKEYFPDWAELPMTCESWLLAPALRQMLPETSNILAFQQAFRITGTDPEVEDVLEWVYRLTKEQQKSLLYSELPEETSLQKKMKAFLLAGGRIGVASGVFTGSFQNPAEG